MFARFSVPAVLIVADRAAPPEDGLFGSVARCLVAAPAEVAPAHTATAISADTPTLRAMRMVARFDNYNPFSFLRLRG